MEKSTTPGAADFSGLFIARRVIQHRRMSEEPSPLEVAIHSIFGFIQRTAEPVANGRTWKTINYKNEPHHSISVFNGVGGISFFLVDYHQRYGSATALELSRDAIDWCAHFDGKHFKRGLHFGQTGVALAALHRAAALGETVTPALSLANAQIIMDESPGPITDLSGGQASNGLYLLKLHAHTGDDTYLRGAERCATWLEQQMVRDEHGTHCQIDPERRTGFGDKVHLGVGHGISGVGHFLALLAAATHSERWAVLARELFDTLDREARPARGGLNWPPFIGLPELPRCQWSHGAAGIGLTYLTAHRVFGDAKYLETALQAAEATYGYGDFRRNYTQCTGLAGCGELLLEVHQATGDSRWRERALDFAHQCLAYRENSPEGDVWPTDGPGLPSVDFDYGASGVGHFLLRVTSDQPPPMPLM
jgi:lantibiotic modifying enzyme